MLTRSPSATDSCAAFRPCAVQGYLMYAFGIHEFISRPWRSISSAVVLRSAKTSMDTPASPTSGEISRTIFRYSAASWLSLIRWPAFTRRTTSGFFAISVGLVVCPSTKPRRSRICCVSPGSPPSTRIFEGACLAAFTCLFIAAVLDIDLPPSCDKYLIAGELLCPNIVFVDFRIGEDMPHRRDHPGWPCKVIDWPLNRRQVLSQHALGDETRSAGPVAPGFINLRHRGDEMESRIVSCALTEKIQKRGILGPTVGIEEPQLVRSLLIFRLTDDAAKGRDADASCKKDCRAVGFPAQYQRAARAVDFDLDAR